jgi:ATP-binding cassette subfamily F protein 3
LETTTTRIISVRDGKVDIYPGGFRDYVAAHQPKEEWPPREQQRKKQSAPPPPPPKDEGRAAFEAQKNATREKERKKRRIVELEQTIASGEKELARLREELREDPKGNWERLAQLAKAEQSLVKRVDAMMSEWAQLSEDKS